MSGTGNNLEEQTHLIVAIAAGVAAIGVVGLLLINFDPRGREARYDPAVLSRTGAVAKAAGATVTPTFHWELDALGISRAEIEASSQKDVISGKGRL